MHDANTAIACRSARAAPGGNVPQIREPRPRRCRNFDRMSARMLRFLTAGESHGQALVVIVEGLPAGLRLTEDDLAADLARRQLGNGRGRRMAIERDRAEI